MAKERLRRPNLARHAVPALGGLAVGWAIKNHKARRQLAAAESSQRQLETENTQLRHEVDHDDLTGLLTKKALIKKGDERLTKNPNRTYALLFMDLDNFKAINDRHPGKYDEGDRTLRSVGNVLLKNARRADMVAHGSREDGEVARLGGDEFAMLVELTGREDQTLSDKERIAAITNRFRAEFRAEFSDRTDLEEIGGLDLSIGAVIHQPGEMMEEMLSRGAALMASEKQIHHARSTIPFRRDPSLAQS